MLVLVAAVAFLLSGAPEAEASGKRGGAPKASRMKTKSVKAHSRTLPGGKKVPVKTHRRSEARR